MTKIENTNASKRHFLSLFLLIFCFLISFNSKSQLQAIRDKADYPFLLNLPSDSILNSKPPILIFLHGRSLSGNNLDIVKRYGVINEIIRGREIPAIVIAPQVMMGKSWEPDKVLNVLQYVQSLYDTDTNRIYVAGMSLGGYGTLNFAGKYPELVAGAVALCGGGNVADAVNLSQVPLWIEHGINDRAVPISESDKVAEAIKKVYDENLLYIRNPTATHGSLERIFHTDEFYDWLFFNIKEPQGVETSGSVSTETPLDKL